MACYSLRGSSLNDLGSSQKATFRFWLIFCHLGCFSKVAEISWFSMSSKPPGLSLHLTSSTGASLQWRVLVAVSSISDLQFKAVTTALNNAHAPQSTSGSNNIQASNKNYYNYNQLMSSFKFFLRLWFPCPHSALHWPTHVADPWSVLRHLMTFCAPLYVRALLFSFQFHSVHHCMYVHCNFLFFLHCSLCALIVI